MIGLLGSTHCVGMCGGIIGALNYCAPGSERELSQRLTYNMAYNAGRISSYAIAGTIVALIASTLPSPQLQSALPFGHLIAAAIMIALGFYFIGWSKPILLLEHAGSHIWRRIKPLGRSLLPARTPLHAFGLGLIWGWLPCGLVYSALALAMASGSPLQGATIMAGFGLGTLPMLLLMGRTADALMNQIRQPAVRLVVGFSLVLLGTYSMASAFSAHDHHQHHHVHAAAIEAGSGSN
jgi:sulfite exporter TauE/SafE